MLGSLNLINAQESKNDFFENTEWQEKVADKDYTENFKEFERKKEKNKTKKAFDLNLKPLIAANTMKLILIVVIVGLLSFLLYLITKGMISSYTEKVPKNNLSSVVDDLDENIHEVDFERLLQQATQNEQFKLAVRILYLNIIKVLADKELIEWKKNKTNGHYLREMNQHHSSVNFSMLTTIYEQSWFSAQALSKNRYTHIATYFTNYIKAIN